MPPIAFDPTHVVRSAQKRLVAPTGLLRVQAALRYDDGGPRPLPVVRDADLHGPPPQDLAVQIADRGFRVLRRLKLHEREPAAALQHRVVAHPVARRSTWLGVDNARR